MPSPYKTNCFDYNKIGCKSRRDCVDKCNIKWSLEHCNSLPENTILDKHDDKNNISFTCNKSYECQANYKLPDCVDEYYTIKPFQIKKLELSKFEILFIKRFNQINLTTKDNDSITVVEIQCYTLDKI